MKGAPLRGFIRSDTAGYLPRTPDGDLWWFRHRRPKWSHRVATRYRRERTLPRAPPRIVADIFRGMC
jgi:hypothetical protein